MLLVYFHEARSASMIERKMPRHLFYSIVAALMLMAPSASFGGQQSATIGGIVKGADGQPVPDASVTLLDQLGNRVAATRTERTGRFRLDDVAPGTYTLLAESAPQRSDARVVTVQAALPIDVELTLSARAAESVVVRGANEAPSAATRVTIAGESLRGMPTRLTSRALQQTLATLPGWGSEDNGLLHVRGVDDGVLYVEDGVPVYDRLDALFGIAPDAASVGSMNVLTGYIPPEYGLKSGAVIEVQSPAAPRTGWTASVDAGLGSDALRAARALGGGQVGPRANLAVNAAHERSNRFLDPVHPDNFHNEGRVFSGEAHLNLLASTNDLVRINAAGGRSRFQVPHGEAEEAAGQNQWQRVVQQSQSASWQRFWSDAIVSQVSLYRRRIDADLHPSANDTPLAASSDRRHDRIGALASLTHQHGRHTMKFGVETARLALHEDFMFAVTDEDGAEGAELSERAEAFTLQDPFRFRDRTNRVQWAFYAQDRFAASERFTVDFGVRFDRTRLLVPASQWSPRLGIAYAWPESSTTLRASVNRLFQPPQPEHLLLSSSAEARALSPFADDDEGAGGADLEPERQTAWEVGIERRVAGTVRLDAAYWSRHVRNYADPNVFFGTTIIFPNSVAEGYARGLDLRLEVARYRGWSSYASYTLSKVEQTGPINGGLFLEENALEIGPGTRFTPDHDQRHAMSAGITYANVKRGFSASLAARYESGTPIEVDEDDLDELMDRPGAQRVDFDTGRVRPRTIVDATIAQTLHRGGRTDVSFRFGVMNLTNDAYALNFSNPFSGTHFGSPRTVRAELRIGLQGRGHPIGTVNRDTQRWVSPPFTVNARRQAQR
jgi:outer membrane receptor protein involved in Fe transport